MKTHKITIQESGYTAPAIEMVVKHNGENYNFIRGIIKEAVLGMSYPPETVLTIQVEELLVTRNKL